MGKAHNEFVHHLRWAKEIEVIFISFGFWWTKWYYGQAGFGLHHQLKLEYGSFCDHCCHGCWHITRIKLICSSHSATRSYFGPIVSCILYARGQNVLKVCDNDCFCKSMINTFINISLYIWIFAFTIACLASGGVNWSSSVKPNVLLRWLTHLTIFQCVITYGTSNVRKSTACQISPPKQYPTTPRPVEVSHSALKKLSCPECLQPQDFHHIKLESLLKIFWCVTQFYITRQNKSGTKTV